MGDLGLKEIERLRQDAELCHKQLDAAVRAWRRAIVERAARAGLSATAIDVGVSGQTIRKWARGIGGVYNHKNILKGKSHG